MNLKRGKSWTSAASVRPRIAVLGAGNMGTALAHALAGNGHEIAVWDYFPAVVDDIRSRSENRRFLPGVRLHSGIQAVNTPAECVSGAELVIVSVPTAFMRSTVMPMVAALSQTAILLNVAKGFIPGTRQLPPVLLERLAAGRRCVHLAGPAIANEFARGKAASVVLASWDADAAQRVAGWFAGRNFLPSITTDLTGAALGGILKNVYAILLGCVDKLSGDSRNLEAAVLTACAREMAAIAVAQGGQAETLYGLPGLGDLVATGFSRDSHNRRFGKMLASGRTVAEIEKEAGWLPEGARSAIATCALAKAGKVRAPLAGWVRRSLAGTPPSVEGLMRSLRVAQPIS